MSASLNHSDSGLTIEDLYPDYVWDNGISGSGEDCGAIDREQQLTQVEEQQDHSGEIGPLDASVASDTEEDNLFQTNLINCYLQDVCRFHLLSQEREIELARTIKEGQEEVVNLAVTYCVAEEYFGGFRKKILDWQSEVESYPGLREKMVEHIVSTLEGCAGGNGSAEICQRLLAEVRAVVSRIDTARDEMVKANLRLVLSIAKRYRGRGLSFLDLIQEGNMGLIRAVSRYDYTKGNRFSTYATWWVRQGIIRALYEKTNTIRLPVHVIEMKSSFYRIVSELAEELDREPTPVEIAERSGLSVDKVTMLAQLSTQPASLEATVGNREQRLGDFLEDKRTVSPLEGISQQELVEVTREVLASLSPREEGVLKSRFGIDGRPTQTLKTIGGHFGVSKERIRQIEKRAIQKLRHTQRSDKLKCFLE
ncbi:MAG: sigma-70 family RNA polymerase sigma factor [Deltaproteobacteria bacterium]|nr:sigma-70 family RNA polymerase sigma factor [Deltaproteobacteria bacterium]